MAKISVTGARRTLATSNRHEKPIRIFLFNSTATAETPRSENASKPPTRPFLRTAGRGLALGQNRHCRVVRIDAFGAAGLTGERQLSLFNLRWRALLSVRVLSYVL